METSEKNLAKLTRLFSLMDEDSLTKEDFLKSFKNVIDFITRMDKALNLKNEKAVANLDNLFKELDTKLSSSTKADVSGSITELKGVVQKALHEQQIGMNFINDKVSKLKNGLDADETKIISKVLKEIPKQKDIVLDTAEELRNKLESLTGEERLDWEAIRGLSEELDTLRASKLGGGGGFSKIALEIHILDPYLPTGDINGVNTDFVLKKIPNPDTSLKVYLGGQLQSLTGDYTLSSKTITFTSKIPQTGETLLVEHRA